ncbi:MAG: ferritin-like domain-containing protein [Flavobacterium sp.]|uniref:YciE/YciF ferroxidase family protein n=1 Tax=Flavobacterium sp. TaxID=239 RepID=UPI002FC8D3AB
MKNNERQKNTDSATKHKNTAVVEANKDAASNLKELFIDALKDIYWAEQALVKALPKMAANASSPKLQSSISDHHAMTENQVVRLEQIFKLLNEKAEGKKCEALAGLLKEGDNMLEETAYGPVRDAAIIAASQKIEHYEIATYGTLFTFAKVLGENDAAKLLQQTLAEEAEADKILTDVATGCVNMDASQS